MVCKLVKQSNASSSALSSAEIGEGTAHLIMICKVIVWDCDRGGAKNGINQTISCIWKVTMVDPNVTCCVDANRISISYPSVSNMRYGAHDPCRAGGNDVVDMYSFDYDVGDILNCKTSSSWNQKVAHVDMIRVPYVISCFIGIFCIFPRIPTWCAHGRILIGITFTWCRCTLQDFESDLVWLWLIVLNIVPNATYYLELQNAMCYYFYCTFFVPR